MVANPKNDIIELLSATDLTPRQSDILKYWLKKYPYFQQAFGIYTAYLKNKNLFYKNLLHQTAARSMDRSVLFDWLEHQAVRKSKAAEKKPEQDKARLPVKKTEESQVKKLPAQTGEKSLKKQEKSFQKPVVIDGNRDEILINEEAIQKFVEPKKKPLKTPEKPSQPQKLSYFEWIKQLNKPKEQKNKEIFDAIEKFLKDRPKIVPKKNVQAKPPVIVEKSVEERQMLMTETLANLYVKQKKYEKAILAFKILSLKYPKKSSYFANRIKEIKKKIK